MHTPFLRGSLSVLLTASFSFDGSKMWLRRLLRVFEPCFSLLLEILS